MTIDPRTAPVGASAEVRLEGAREQLGRKVHDQAIAAMDAIRQGAEATLKALDETPLDDFDPDKVTAAVVAPLIAFMTAGAGVDKAQRLLKEMTATLDVLKALDPETLA